MSKKSKKKLDAIGIKPGKTARIFPLIAATIVGLAQKVLLMAMRMVGKEKHGRTTLPKSDEMAIESEREGGSSGVYYANPLVASMKGVDGKTTFGSIDDYWTSYDNEIPDPYKGSDSGNAHPL